MPPTHRMTPVLGFLLAVGIAAGSFGVGQVAPQDAPRASQPALQQCSSQQPALPPLYDESANAAELIDAALERAKRDNTRVLIQWGANWCGWCRLLHEHCATNRDVARKLLYEYEVVLVDVGRMNRNMDLANEYRADFKSSGIPYLTILDAEGNVVVNRETGSLELPPDPEAKAKPGHDAAKVLDFLTQHQAPYLNAQTALEGGLRQAKASGRPVLLHFGAPWCGWCKRFDAWLARPQVRPIVEQYFVPIKIDVDRTIGGKEIMDQYTKGMQTGIPWFAFLDADSNVLANSQGPNGNIGCPHSPEEVRVFRSLLRAAAPGMSDDELSLVLSFLGEGVAQQSGRY